MVIELPSNVRKIIGQIEEKGFEAYAVGGCVRDSILGRKPMDWDITTNAKPEDIKKIFGHTIDTGIQHGTVTVMLGRTGYEVTTYRTEGTYLDHRHPSDVEFVSELSEDLRRRDFTINAMAYNETRGLVDLFGGIEDLSNKIIRCVGKATDRFSEDALRMMRAVRFSAQLGFEIDKDTENAISELCPQIDAVSRERVQTELLRLISSENPSFWAAASRTGLGRQILPEFEDTYDPGDPKSKGALSLRALKLVPDTKGFKTAVFLSGIRPFEGKSREQSVKSILRRLKFDNDTIKRASTLVGMLDENIPADSYEIRLAMSRRGKVFFPDYLKVREALNKAGLFGEDPEEKKRLREMKRIYELSEKEHWCTCIGELKIGGGELKALGFSQGKAMGDALKILLSEVLKNPSLNDETILQRRAKEIRNELS